MLEAVLIIVALGGLELLLWRAGHKQQKKQIDLLDSIWAELAIRNAQEEERRAPTNGAARPAETTRPTRN